MLNDSDSKRARKKILLNCLLHALYTLLEDDIIRLATEPQEESGACMTSLVDATNTRKYPRICADRTLFVLVYACGVAVWSRLSCLGQLH